MALSIFFKKNQSMSSESPHTPLGKTVSSTSWDTFEKEELVVDMFDRGDALVIRAMVAGIPPENLDVAVHNDMVTISGTREEMEEVFHDRFFMRECRWGHISRIVILPIAVHTERIKAYLKHGVLTIVIPRKIEEKSIDVVA